MELNLSAEEVSTWALVLAKARPELVPVFETNSYATIIWVRFSTRTMGRRQLPMEEAGLLARGPRISPKRSGRSETLSR